MAVFMTKQLDVSVIINRLIRVAQGRELTANRPWNYGWSQATYRRSATAAMTYKDNQGISLQASAVDLLEEAASTLLKVQQIRDYYDANEFWSLIASLIGALPLDSSPEHLANEIEQRIKRLIDPPDSLVVMPVANLAPPQTVVEIGNLLIGHLDTHFETRLREKSGHPGLKSMSVQPWWMPLLDDVDEAVEPRPNLIAHIGRTQLRRAIDDAEQAFDDVISLSLMAEPDLDRFSLYSLRGVANRPGVRGLGVDRSFLTKTAQSSPPVTRELGAAMFVDGILGPTLMHRWYGEDPFPLEQLLGHSDNRSIVERVFSGSTAVHHRLTVAARWHAKAHWALDPADAVLALGICFDSMLSEQGPSPGRVISERFALLHPDPNHRDQRYRRFQTGYYPARSSVAHGAKKTSVDAAFVREMAKETRWVFQRILQLTQSLKVRTEDEYDNMYFDLKWGRYSVHTEP